MKPFTLFPYAAVNASISDRFHSIVEQFPDKCAIHSEAGATSYAELLDKSNRIAFALCNEAEQSPVGLLLPQGPEFIAGMFGCLAAAMPYAPLDSSYPVSRLKLMIEVVKPAVLITNKSNFALAESIKLERTKVIKIEDLPKTNLNISRGSAESPAYILFTSGSTGKPKGVLDLHKNVLHNVLRQTNSFFYDADDRQSLLYTCGVYGGARDIFCAILNGATLFHYDIEKSGYTKLGPWVKHHKISIYCSVATIFRYLSQYLNDPTEVESIRIIKLGGEASRRSDVSIFKKLFSEKCLFYTGLASTETGTVCQFPITQKTQNNDELLPLGYPAIDTKIVLSLSNGQRAPQGEIGEILIDSDYLSVGYFCDPDQTAKKFISLEGRRLYRTGDLGRIDANGCLWHCGRGDKQVKIRGNRVELAEVESALLRVDHVNDAVVVAESDQTGEASLIAYVAPRLGSSIDETTVRKRLLGAIPTFMVPAAIVVMPALPRTINGKIDRTQLPKPEIGMKENGPTVTHEFDLGLVGSLMRRVWKQILNLPDIDPDANFFAIGGHSLKLVQLITEVEIQTGVRISIQEFLKDPTIRHTVNLIRNWSPASSNPLIVYSECESEECLLMLPGIGGSELPFKLLIDELKPTWTIISSQFCDEKEDVLQNLELLVSNISDGVQNLAKGKRVHVIGYSFGGLLAASVVEELNRRRCDIGRVFILDPDPPFGKPEECKLLTPTFVPIVDQAKQNEHSDTLAGRIARTMKAMRQQKLSWRHAIPYKGSVYLLYSGKESKMRQEAQLEQWPLLFPLLESFEFQSSHMSILSKENVYLVADTILEKISGSNAKKLKKSS